MSFALAPGIDMYYLYTPRQWVIIIVICSLSCTPKAWKAAWPHMPDYTREVLVLASHRTNRDN